MEYLCTELQFLIEFLMDEIEQRVMEKWSNWTSNFLKTNGNFFHITGLSGFVTREKTKGFTMDYPIASERFSIERWMKKLNPVFLSKSEFNF